jgi:hypothetical protein
LCGRGLGKSYVAGYWCFKKLVESPGMGLLIAPTYSQAENTLKSVFAVLDKFGVEYTWNKHPVFAQSWLPSHTNVLSINVNNELKQLRLGSADQYDNLRGGNYSWLCFDEAAMADERAYQTLAPCLRGQGTKFQYQQLLLSTPRGRNWLYNNFVSEEHKSIEVIRAGSAENFIEYTADKIAFLQSTMSKRMFEQEVLGLIVEQNTNAVFYSFANETCTTDETNWDGRLFISSDQNISPLCSILGSIKTGMIHINEECYIEDNGNVKDMARMIHGKIPLKPGRIEVYGDRSGRNRTLVGSAFYDQLFEELKKLGWYCVNRTNTKNPPVYDSAEEVNRSFEQRKLVINKKCQNLIRDMDMAKYKDNSLDIDKKEYDPHLADALRYMAYENRPSAGGVARTNFA